MSNHRGHVLFLQSHHLLLLLLVLTLVTLITFQQQDLSCVLVSQRILMEVKQLLGLLDHELEEGERCHLEVALHRIYILALEDKTLRVSDTLHGEESFVQAFDAILVKLKGVIIVDAIVHHCSRVNDRVFAAKVLHHTLSSRLLQVRSLWINHTEYTVLVLGDHIAEDSLDAEVKVVDVVSLLVKIDVLRCESWAKLRGHPG